MAGTRIRTGLAALLASAAFAVVGAPAYGLQEEGSDERVQPPAELLREYPFDQGRLSSRDSPSARRAGAGSAMSTAAGDGGSGWTVMWLALGAAALLAVLALIALRSRRLKAAGPSNWDLERRIEDTGKLVPDADPGGPRPASASPSARFPRRARPESAANRYAVANQKGGVGKTTVSLVLGAAAARRGNRVLLVDLDPQASATSVLGVDADGQPSVADVIVDGSRLLPEAVVPTSWGLDLVPAQRRLREADVGTFTADESMLGWALEAVLDYDLVLIDCPPSLGRLTLQAFTAVSQVLVVTEPTYLALHAMGELFDTLRSVAADQDRSIELGGVLLNRVESTAEHKRSVAELEATFGSRLWTPHIPKRAILQDAMRQGIPPQDLRTHSHYADEIAQIFDQIVERLMAVKLKS